MQDPRTSLRLSSLEASTRNRTSRERNTISRLSLFNRHMRSSSMNDRLWCRTTEQLSLEDDSPFAISDSDSDSNKEKNSEAPKNTNVLN